MTPSHGQCSRKPKVTVVASTWRPGGLDIFFAGMRAQTYPDFEILLVDHRREQRLGIVAEKVKEYGLKNFYHVPEHRCDKFFHAGAGWISGFLAAEGEITCMLQDYAYAPPGWIEAHLQAHQFMTPTICLGQSCNLHITDEMLPFQIDEFWNAYSLTEEPESVKGGYGEFTVFHEPFQPDWIPTLKVQLPPDQDPKFVGHQNGQLPRGAILFWYCHGKNVSFPTERCLRVGGVDEQFDHGKGPWDNEFAFRFTHAGCTCWFEPEAIAFHLDPRRFIRTMPWGDMEKPVAGRWSYWEGYQYQNKRYAEVGRPGETIFVGEECIIGTGSCEPKANNPYDFAEKRDGYLRLKPEWRIA